MHVALALVFWGWIFSVLAKLFPRDRGVWFAACVVLVACAAAGRLLALAHYVSDILGGVLLGLVCFSGHVRRGAVAGS
ncbi:MAG: phosphatase PAP2 family protein [Nitrosarchaeum sp.]|nr:phosphatase PAP2 family protein [Nitrosarchaeum sp.]